MKDARIYLQHILTCIERIQRYTGGDAAHFLNDEKTQDAVLYQLRLIRFGLAIAP